MDYEIRTTPPGKYPQEIINEVQKCCVSGDMEGLRRLDDLKTIYGYSPLMEITEPSFAWIAASNGHYEMVQYLLEENCFDIAEIDAISRHSVMDWAITNWPQPKIITMIFDALRGAKFFIYRQRIMEFACSSKNHCKGLVDCIPLPIIIFAEPFVNNPEALRKLYVALVTHCKKEHVTESRRYDLINYLFYKRFDMVKVATEPYALENVIDLHFENDRALLLAEAMKRTGECPELFYHLLSIPTEWTDLGKVVIKRALLTPDMVVLMHSIRRWNNGALPFEARVLINAYMLAPAPLSVAVPLVLDCIDQRIQNEIKKCATK